MCMYVHIYVSLSIYIYIHTYTSVSIHVAHCGGRASQLINANTTINNTNSTNSSTTMYNAIIYDTYTV